MEVKKMNTNTNTRRGINGDSQKEDIKGTFSFLLSRWRTVETNEEEKVEKKVKYEQKTDKKYNVYIVSMNCCLRGKIRDRNKIKET